MRDREGALAARYEKTYPGTGAPDAQKAERQERIEHRAERVEHRRTGRNRGIVVPALPWLRDRAGGGG